MLTWNPADPPPVIPGERVAIARDIHLGIGQPVVRAGTFAEVVEATTTTVVVVTEHGEPVHFDSDPSGIETQGLDFDDAARDLIPLRCPYRRVTDLRSGRVSLYLPRRRRPS